MSPTQTPSIQRLPDHVANQIAAGEVVERPASVVKELLENALDAGATRIDVYLEDGGRGLIRVVDNGSGIAQDEVALAFERHATSKIRTSSELSRVSTYGFRGEALASIASVAAVEMKTRRVSDDLGTHASGDGRGHLALKPVSCAPGTDLSVVDLFAAVPARREFLRTAATELGHVIRLLDAVALARIDLALRLFHNGRKVSDFPAAPDLPTRVAAVLGKDIAEHLHPVSGDGPYAVDGMLSAPTRSRGTSAGLVLLVDGRPVSDATLVHAVRTAYGSRLPERRFPVGVLRLTCPPATVDVNVHPSKTEVRFLSKQAIHAAVVAAVAKTLDTGAWLQHEDASVPGTRKGDRPHPSPGPRRRSYLSDLFNPPDLGAASQESRPRTQPAKPAPAPIVPPIAPPLRVPDLVPNLPVTSPSRRPSRSTISLIVAGEQNETQAFDARFVGTVAHKWLLFECDDSVVFVDRGAAARAGVVAAGGAPSQRLMIPLPVKLGPPLVSALKPAFARAKRHGLELAAGPRGGVLVRTAPHVLGQSAIDALVRQLAGSLVAAGHEIASNPMHALIDDTIAQACSPKPGEVISDDRAIEIVRRLDGIPLAARQSGVSVVIVRSLTAVLGLD